MPAAETERREFPRLKRVVSVRYKFLSSTVQDAAMERVCDGSTKDLSLGGMMLTGPIPRLDWVKDLLLGRISIGVNLVLPPDGVVVKILTRVAWLEAIEENALSLRMGLRAVDIPPEHRKVLGDFLATETSAL